MINIKNHYLNYITHPKFTNELDFALNSPQGVCQPLVGYLMPNLINL